MEEPYLKGLRYLSRLEEDSAKTSLLEQERKRATLDDIQEDELSATDKLFIAEVKSMIEAWVNNTDVSISLWPALLRENLTQISSLLEGVRIFEHTSPRNTHRDAGRHARNTKRLPEEISTSDCESEVS